MRPSFVLAFLGTLFLFLAVFLFPATVCGCKVASKATACLSNVRQQALGLLMYADDHDDRFARHDFWEDDIRPYVKSEDVFRDPGSPKGTYGYAFNAALSAAKSPKDAANVPLVYESTNPIRNASDKFVSLPRPGRHGERNAVAYADGHAKRMATGWGA